MNDDFILKLFHHINCALKDWAHFSVGDLPRKIKTTRKELNKCLNVEENSFDHAKVKNLKS